VEEEEVMVERVEKVEGVEGTADYQRRDEPTRDGD
jgi:hypothetical protein